MTGTFGSLYQLRSSLISIFYYQILDINSCMKTSVVFKMAEICQNKISQIIGLICISLYVRRN